MGQNLPHGWLTTARTGLGRAVCVHRAQGKKVPEGYSFRQGETASPRKKCSRLHRSLPPGLPQGAVSATLVFQEKQPERPMGLVPELNSTGWMKPRKGPGASAWFPEQPRGGTGRCCISWAPLPDMLIEQGRAAINLHF